jgi:hypothetical protein
MPTLASCPRGHGLAAPHVGQPTPQSHAVLRTRWAHIGECLVTAMIRCLSWAQWNNYSSQLAFAGCQDVVTGYGPARTGNRYQRRCIVAGSAVLLVAALERNSAASRPGGEASARTASAEMSRLRVMDEPRSPEDRGTRLDHGNSVVSTCRVHKTALRAAPDANLRPPAPRAGTW